MVIDRIVDCKCDVSCCMLVPMLQPFDTKDQEHPEATENPSQGSAPDVLGRRSGAIRCIQCGHLITSPEFLVTVDGSAHHTFANPAGQVFNIGCFSSAKGILGTGEFTSHFSWFDGYAWQSVVCGKCFFHLGWVFEAQTRFYGLIADRLTG